MEENKSVEATGNEQTKSSIAAALKFSKIIRTQFPDVIKGILLFGSAAKGSKKTGDIDVLVILDDTNQKISDDQLDRIDEHIRLIADEHGIHPQIHDVTDFWDWIRHGDPILFNFLRYGFPLYDSGFLKPTQRLLEEGRITPSEEAIRLYSKIPPKNIEKAESYIKAAVIKYYDAMTAAAQAVSMSLLKHQPEPREIPSVLQDLVKDSRLEQKFVDYYVEIFQLWKKIDHKEMEIVSGEILQNQRNHANEFVEKMKQFLKSYAEE